METKELMEGTLKSLSEIEKFMEGIHKAARLSNLSNGEIRVITGKTFDEKPPAPIKLKGTISAPRVFLLKRVFPIYYPESILAADPEIANPIDPTNAHLVVDRESGTIVLVFNEDCPYGASEVTGEIYVTKEYTSWGINNPQKSWTPADLAEHIRMNRLAFDSPEVAASLFKLLKDFKAKIEKTLNQQSDDRANYDFRKSQAVETNLPERFSLSLPVIKGQPRETMMVEIIIRPESLNCYLISPDAKDLEYKLKDALIENEISAIQEAVPAIPIIEE